MYYYGGTSKPQQLFLPVLLLSGSYLSGLVIIYSHSFSTFSYLASRSCTFGPTHQLSFFNDSLNPHNMFPAIDYLFPDQMVSYVNGNKLGIDHLNSIATVNGDCNLNLSPSTITTNHNSESSPAPSSKPCMYFARGYCKHGSNCRFLHGYTRQENALPLSLSGSPTGSRNSDEAFQAGSLERLEFELQELLRGKRAPVSIASLP